MKICDARYCIGCGTCEKKCPVQAIKIVQDENGFAKTIIDEDKCIQCKVCMKVCPILGNNTKFQQFSEIYFAVKASNDIREISASGGVLYVLAEEMLLTLGGTVCGTDRKQNFRYVLTRDIAEVKKMLEYQRIQNQPGEVFADIEELLVHGKKVLFFGTPCHAAALKAFLGKDYADLYIVDSVCEGVTSNKFLNYYLQEYFPEKVAKAISFRDKAVYRWAPSMTIEFDDGTVFRENSDMNPFMKALTNGVSLCDACGENCRFNHKYRCADITIGDFWPVGEYDESHGTKLFDSLGVSIVKINSEKGRELFKSCQLRFTDVVEVKEEDAVYRNYLSLPRLYNTMREKRIFLKTVNELGFKKAFLASVENQHDVALFGLWNGGNYGAIISANALYETLQALGCETVFIDTEFSYGRRDERLLEYIKSRCNISKKYRSSMECYELNEHFSCFVVGSDQCWNTNLNTMYNNIFLLECANNSVKKISYSTSFGPSRFEDLKEREKFKFFLERFDSISVRESSGKEICENIFNREAVWVADPILLRERAEYEAETKNIEIESKDFVLNYLLDIRPQTMDIVDEINRKSGCTRIVRILGADMTNPWDLDISDTVQNPSVYEFVCYFLRCDYVVTDSYHGMCLAILFNKPFSVLINEGRGRDRFDSLLGRLDLRDRAVEYGDSTFVDSAASICWDKVNEKLSSFKKESMEWLRNSLKKEKKNNLSEYDFLRQKLYEQNNNIIEMTTELNAYKYRTYNPYIERMARFFQEQISYRSIVVIRGGGLHTRKLLEIIIPILDRKCAELIIMDKNPEEISIGLRRFQVIVPSAEIIRSSDAVIISTWRYRREVLHEVENICAELKIPPKIIEMYEALNMDVSQPFYLDKDWREY